MHARVVGPFMGQVLFSCLAVIAVAWLGAPPSHACNGPDCDRLVVAAAIVPEVQGVTETETMGSTHEASLAPTIGIVERLGCSGSGAAQGLVLGALVILGLITRKEGEHP